MADERNLDAIEIKDDSTLPRVIKFDALDRSQNVDSIGRITELDDPVRLVKILFGKTKIRKPKRFERPYNSRGILGTYPDRSIEVTGVTRQPVSGNGVSTDDEKVNIVSGEEFYKVSEVRVELHCLPHSSVDEESQHPRRARHARRSANI